MTALASEAVVLAEATDFINHRADPLMDLSQVLKASGRGTRRSLLPPRRCVSTNSRKPRLRSRDSVVARAIVA